ncbi:MAG: hypothetical protein ACLTG0_03790 [Oscillibacter sp.]
MDKKKRTRELIVFAVIVLALLAGCLLTPSGGERANRSRRSCVTRCCTSRTR